MADYGKTIFLDSNGDVQFDSVKKLKLTAADTEKVPQDCRVALKTILTEDIFSPSFGFDMLKIKAHGYNKQLIEAEITAALKKYKYLKSIDKLDVGKPDANRNVPVSMNITTTKDLSLAIGAVI